MEADSKRNYDNYSLESLDSSVIDYLEFEGWDPFTITNIDKKKIEARNIIRKASKKLLEDLLAIKLSYKEEFANNKHRKNYKTNFINNLSCSKRFKKYSSVGLSSFKYMKNLLTSGVNKIFSFGKNEFKIQELFKLETNLNVNNDYDDNFSCRPPNFSSNLNKIYYSNRGSIKTLRNRGQYSKQLQKKNTFSSILSERKEDGIYSVYQQEKFFPSNFMDSILRENSSNTFKIESSIRKNELPSDKNQEIENLKSSHNSKICIAKKKIGIENEKNPFENIPFDNSNLDKELTFSMSPAFRKATLSKSNSKSPPILEKILYGNHKLNKLNKKNEISEFDLPYQGNYNVLQNTCHSHFSKNTTSRLLPSPLKTNISKNTIKEDYLNDLSKRIFSNDLEAQTNSKRTEMSSFSDSNTDQIAYKNKNLIKLKSIKLYNDNKVKIFENGNNKLPTELLQTFKTIKTDKTEISNIRSHKSNISNKSDLSSWFTSPWTKTLIKKKSKLIKDSEDRNIFVFKNIYDSIGSDEYKSEDEEGYVIMWEESPFRKFYEFIMLICIMYSCTISPYYMAFSLESDSITVFETLMDGLFITEIVFNFLTPFRDGDKEVTNQMKMFKNYLKNGFFFDVISSIPNSLMSSLGAKNLNLKAMRLLKITRMFKLIKWLATIKVHHGENEDLEDSSMDRLMKLLVFFLILSHISTCMWIYVGLNVWHSEGDSWIPSNGFANAENIDIYVCSLYYNLVTIFTIGYGDIHSVTITETTYIIFFMFISTLMWSFAVSSMSQIFLNMSIEHKIFSEKIKILNDINEKHPMSRELYVNISHNLKNSKEASNERFEFLETLPYTLKKECLISMTKKGIKSLNFFKGQHREFLIFVLPMLHSIRIRRDESLISIGDFIEEMYIVKKGVLAIRLGDELGHVEVSQVPEKNHFGEIFMYLNENSQYLVTGRTSICDVFCISKFNFTKIKMSYNEFILSILSKSCIFLERIEKLKNIVVEFFNLGLTIKEIKSLIKKLNLFCFHGQLDSFLNMDELGKGTTNIEEVEDFILSNDVYDLVNFLNSPMNYGDFLRYFFEKVENPHLKFARRGAVKPTYLIWNNITYQRKNAAKKDDRKASSINALGTNSGLKFFQMFNHAEVNDKNNEERSGVKMKDMIIGALSKNSVNTSVRGQTSNYSSFVVGVGNSSFNNEHNSSPSTILSMINFKKNKSGTNLIEERYYKNNDEDYLYKSYGKHQKINLKQISFERGKESLSSDIGSSTNSEASKYISLKSQYNKNEIKSELSIGSKRVLGENKDPYLSSEISSRIVEKKSHKSNLCPKKYSYSPEKTNRKKSRLNNEPEEFDIKNVLSKLSSTNINPSNSPNKGSISYSNSPTRKKNRFNNEPEPEILKEHFKSFKTVKKSSNKNINSHSKENGQDLDTYNNYKILNMKTIDKTKKCKRKFSQNVVDSERNKNLDHQQQYESYKDENNILEEMVNFNLNSNGTFTSTKFNNDNGFKNYNNFDNISPERSKSLTKNDHNKKLKPFKLKTYQLPNKDFTLSNTSKFHGGTKNENKSALKSHRNSKTNLNLENITENLYKLMKPPQVYNIFNYGGQFNQNFIYSRNEPLQIIRNDTFNLNINCTEKSENDIEISLFNAPTIQNLPYQYYDNSSNTYSNTNTHNSKTFRFNTNSQNPQLINANQMLNNPNFLNSSKFGSPLMAPTVSQFVHNNNLINVHNFPVRQDVNGNVNQSVQNLQNFQGVFGHQQNKHATPSNNSIISNPELFTNRNNLSFNNICNEQAKNNEIILYKQSFDSSQSISSKNFTHDQKEKDTNSDNIFTENHKKCLKNENDSGYEIKEIPMKKLSKIRDDFVQEKSSSCIPQSSQNENANNFVDKEPKYHTPNETQNFHATTQLKGDIRRRLPLPSQKKSLREKIGIESKSREVIFQEVTKGLYIDEMFHLDKHFIKDKIDSVLSERREIREIASKAFKKLKNMLFFIKEVNK